MIREFLKDTSGNIAVMFSVTVIFIIFAVAVVVDLSIALSAKNKMQNTLDNATLFAALNSEVSNYSELGQEFFELSATAQKLDVTQVSFEKQDDSMIGTASGDLTLFFGGVLPKDVLNIQAKSIAKVSAPSSQPCIIALSETASPGIRINEGTTIEASGCTMHTHAQNGNSLTANSNIDINLDNICVAGSTVLDNSNGAIGPIETNCDAASDPFAGTIAEPSSSSCDFTGGNFGAGAVTLRPGVYCGFYNFNDANIDVTFEPGVYVIRSGAWNINGGRWSGDGVSFYFYDNTRLQFNSGVRATFTAPTTGDYAGVFITEREGLNRGQFIINDTEGFNFDGIVYLPSKDLVMNGGATVDARKMTIVSRTIEFNSSRLIVEVDETSTDGTVIGPYLSD